MREVDDAAAGSRPSGLTPSAIECQMGSGYYVVV